MDVRDVLAHVQEDALGVAWAHVQTCVLAASRVAKADAIADAKAVAITVACSVPTNFLTPMWPVFALATFLNHCSCTFMSRLSSTTLFHFTHEFDTLVKILEEGLWPRYCVERDWGDKDLIIPMVCTCEIPLSKMSFHQNKYGKYGIGLSKKWAKKKGFTPVLYVSDKSDIYKRICK